MWITYFSPYYIIYYTVKKILYLLFGLCVLISSNAYSRKLAFPGAAGFGRYAEGGRYGSVYHVTNLNDSGSGSLRDAVSSPNRIVVFDVAGIIKISSRMVFSKNLYVAGQTAPGEGITVYGNGVSFSGASNIIVRYMRFRMGASGTSGADAAGISNGTNMIFDHVSASWGRDETFSINPDGKGALGNITIQNSIIGQGLLTHSAGGLIQADSITIYRNLYIDNGTRNAKIKGRNQYVNNIIYNWKSAAYIMGGESSTDAYCNATDNLFIKGPAGGSTPFSRGSSTFHLYADGNYYDSNADGTLDPYLIPESEYSGGPDFQDAPYNYPELQAYNAPELIDSMLYNIGANLPYRDPLDWFLIKQVVSLGTEGNLISAESQNSIGIPTSWNIWQGTERADSDNDGIPDVWEAANGTDSNKNDAMDIASNGYTNIENYINSLTAGSGQPYLRAPESLGLSESTQSSITLSWSDYTEGEDGFSIEMKQDDGNFKEVKNVTENIESCVIDMLNSATAYTFRMRAYTGTDTSDYSSAITLKTKPEEVEIINPDNFVQDMTWNVGDSLWNHSSSNWLDTLSVVVPFKDSSKVLFDADDKDYVVSITDTVSVSAVVVKGSGNVTFDGPGVISGKGSVNKSGNGTLILNDSNTYTGASVLSGGTVEFSSLRNENETSSLGSSQNFAQNWVWKGGVWKYTGASTSTDRNAVMYDNTEFNIAGSNTKVSFNGDIEGNGDFILNGQGTLNITDPFIKYTGNTILKGGMLYLDGSAAIDSGLCSSPKLILAGGTLKTHDAKERYPEYNFPIEIENNTYSTINLYRNCYFNSNITGNGDVEFQVNYLREYIQGDWRGFTGRLIVNGVNSTSGDCQLIVNNYDKDGFPNAVIYTKGNVQIVSWKASATVYLGGLSGEKGTYLSGSSKKTDSAKNIWVVGGANTDETFKGVIDDRCSASRHKGTSSIVKEGDGSWRLTGTNVYSGTTTVKAGSLIVNGYNSGSGTVTVKADATLAGTGSVKGRVVMESGSILRAGDTIVDNSALNLKSGLILNSSCKTIIPVLKDGFLASNRKADMLYVSGTASLAGDLVLDIKESDYNLSADNYFTIMDLSGATVSGQFDNIYPVIPAEGLKWDVSELYTRGRIYVRDESYVGIDNVVSGNTDVSSEIAGNKVYISLPDGYKDVSVKICSCNGRIMKNIKISEDTDIDVSFYSPGLYFLNITDSRGGIGVKKFIKQ